VPAAESALAGKPPDAASFRMAADALLKGAQPQRHNAFKVELARRSIIRALTNVAALA
jgi:xanthine dehydrogenase YagS FAD-binding subunit